MNAQTEDRPESAAEGSATVMQTPDGRVFQAQASGSPLTAAGGAVLDITRALGKLVATIWRLARALDSALWRGVKLIARTGWRAIAAAAAAIARAFREFAAWIPTRAGRAYSAASGLFLLVMALWIVDELRAAASISETGETITRPPVDRDDPIVARMGGRYIHLSDIRAAAMAAGQLRENEVLTVQTAFSRDLVHSFVEQRLLSRAAIEEGIHRTPEAARRLIAARDRILAAAYMDSRLTETVTPEAVERLYASQADVTRLGDEVRARHIVLRTVEEASAVKLELVAGADFAELARERSIDRSTAPLGGEIGYFSKDMMTPALSAAAFGTAPGATAPIFQTEFGWHVLEILDRRPTSGVSLKSVEDNIKRFLTLRMIEQTLEGLKTAEKVTFYIPEKSKDPDIPAPHRNENTADEDISGGGAGGGN